MLACRTEAAELFHVSEPDRVILTSNATHGLNIAIKSLVPSGGRVVISGYEHNAVTRPLHGIEGVSVQVVNGRLFEPEQMLEGFEKAVTEETAAVVCNHVSNVFGYALPVDEIAEICRKRGVPLIVDASQSAGILPVDADGWDAAFVAMPGHKGLYGPQGTGLLLCGKERTVKTLLEGGTGSLSLQQEMPDFLPDRLEAGTQNVHGAAGLLEGIRFVRRMGIKVIAEKVHTVVDVLADGLVKTGRYHVFRGKYAGSVLSVVPLERTPEEMADRLAERDVAVRSGFHCAPLAHMSGGTLKTGTLRFSASVFNDTDEAERVLELL